MILMHHPPQPRPVTIYTCNNTSTAVFTMLSKLPDEVTLLIVGHMDRLRDLNSLCCTNKRFHALLNDRVYRLDVKQTSGASLIWAAETGQLQTARMSLAAGAAVSVDRHSTNLANKPPSFCRGHYQRWKSIHFAAHNDEIPMLQLLIAHGADVNYKAKGSGGVLPLSVCDISNCKTVEHLFNNGANLRATDDHGETIFDRVIDIGSQSALEYLVPHFGPFNTDTQAKLISAVTRRNNVPAAELLYQHGAPIFPESPQIHGPLHIAISMQHWRMIRWLLSKGALASPTMTSGIRCKLIYDIAKLALVDSLLKNGVDINCRGAGGKTVLHMVAGDGDKYTMKRLLAKGADLRLLDDLGRSPLYVACSGYQRFTTELLIEHGASILDDEHHILRSMCHYRNAPFVNFILEKSLRTDAMMQALADVLPNCSSEQVALTFREYLDFDRE